jgi:hypothetical protein
MIRFGFTIRTKSGQRVDNIQIMAATPFDAERRLRQMYQQCVIVERREQAVAQRSDAREGAPSDDRNRAPPSARRSGTQ